MDKFKIAIEVLNFLLQKGTFISTSEIQRHLVSINLLESLSPKSKDRRKLNRILVFLESEGYIESERINARGRKPQRWKVNENALPYLVSISDEELTSLLTFVSFIPDSYKELSIFSPLMQLIVRLSKKFSENKLDIIKKSFVYESQFLEKFILLKQDVLLQIHKAIIKNKALRIRYKQSEAFKIFPLKIFVYNGIIYIGALRENKSYRTYHLAGIDVLEELEENLPKFYRKKYEDVTFYMEDEKPFLFGVRLPFKESLNYFSNIQIFPTQFFFKKESNESYLIYLVGFLGSRFTSRFLVEEVIEVIPPSKEILNTAKERKLKLKYPNLSLSLNLNRQRFFHFVDELSYFIDQRRRAISHINIKNPH